MDFRNLGASCSCPQEPAGAQRSGAGDKPRSGLDAVRPRMQKTQAKAHVWAARGGQPRGSPASWPGHGASREPRGCWEPWTPHSRPPAQQPERGRVHRAPCWKRVPGPREAPGRPHVSVRSCLRLRCPRPREMGQQCFPSRGQRVVREWTRRPPGVVSLLETVSTPAAGEGRPPPSDRPLGTWVPEGAGPAPATEGHWQSVPPSPGTGLDGEAEASSSGHPACPCAQPHVTEAPASPLSLEAVTQT